MDGKQFDAMSKAAAESGRRAVLQRLGGGMVGGLLALIGTSSMSAKPKKAGKAKKQKKGDASAAAKDKDKNSGNNGNNCCSSCPPTGNECTAVVRDASSGECVHVERVAGTLCNNSRGICEQGRCIHCQDNEVICGLACADLQTSPFFCGDCETRCNVPFQRCEAGTCVDCENELGCPPPVLPPPA